MYYLVQVNLVEEVVKSIKACLASCDGVFV